MALIGFSGPQLVLVLVFAHLLCDYPLQSDKIATGKCPGSAVAGITWPYWLAGHVGTHALAVTLLTGNAWIGLADFIAHGLIDYGTCRGLDNLAMDQGLHIACKIAWASLA